MKKYTRFSLVVILALSFIHNAYGVTDEMILKDPVQSTYYGRTSATDIIKNLQFKDVSSTDWAQEAIIRSGALDIVKGYDQNYNPTGTVSNQEAIAFVVRALGLEKQAQQEAVTFAAQLPANSPLRTLWSIGYLEVARKNGIITQQQMDDALLPDPNVLNPQTNFIRTAPATREEIADYLTKGLQTLNADLLTNTSSVQGIYTFHDWDQITVDKVAAVEFTAANKIINGDSTGNFRPKSAMSRGELAQVFKNMDAIYLNLMGIQKKTGTVALLQERQVSETGNTNYVRDILIRTTGGSVDVLKYEFERNSAPQSGKTDAVVLKNGIVGGLTNLAEGDQIEYLVTLNTPSILYASVTDSTFEEKQVMGKLKNIDSTQKLITLVNDQNNEYLFPLSEGVIETQINKDKTIDTYLFVDKKKQNVKQLPLGSNYQLTLHNNVVVSIQHIGTPVLEEEVRGIVTENNVPLGYISFIDNTGTERTMYYNENDMKVEKQTHYDVEDEIGAIDNLFPNFHYDPRDTVIDAVEPGDIVFIHPTPENPETIGAISAATNYISKYGKVKEYVDKGEYYRLLIQYEDQQTAWFDVAKDIFVSKDSKPIKTSQVVVGDVVRILVNQAIIRPGYVIESAKELVVEGDEHAVSTILKGQLAGMNTIQNKLQLQNVQQLETNGWTNYKQMTQLNLNSRDIEYYYNDQRISLDYAMTHLKRADGEVYVALENNYAGEKVKKVSFRDGRDELLKPDTVLATNANGSIQITGVSSNIETDSATIVRKNGRLVSGSDINASDYATIALNDGRKAAVVDITTTPATSGLLIARARVQQVDTGKSFRVQSMSLLNNMDWLYSPVNREYTIDYNTLYLNAEGYIPQDQFLDYSNTSVVDKTYNIIVDGTKATHIIESPYATKAVTGEIYSIDGNVVGLKNARYYDNTSGKWFAVSNTNATVMVTIPNNSAIVKNNSVVYTKDLAVGQKLKVMTNIFPNKITGGMGIIGYIILVEK